MDRRGVSGSRGPTAMRLVLFVATHHHASVAAGSGVQSKFKTAVLAPHTVSSLPVVLRPRKINIHSDSEVLKGSQSLSKFVRTSNIDGHVHNVSNHLLFSCTASAQTRQQLSSKAQKVRHQTPNIPLWCGVVSGTNTEDSSD
eukprot:scaffold34524_cov73-Cyclotella_meneghiniana.AAC.5